MMQTDRAPVDLGPPSRCADAPELGILGRRCEWGPTAQRTSTYRDGSESGCQRNRSLIGCSWCLDFNYFKATCQATRLF